jgi:hypothetical protein
MHINMHSDEMPLPVDTVLCCDGKPARHTLPLLFFVALLFQIVISATMHEQ